MKLIVEFQSPDGMEDKAYEEGLLSRLKLENFGRFKVLNTIPSGEITFDLIEQKVSEHTGIPIEKIHIKSRDQYIVEARRLCFYLSAECNVGTSWRERGERFGNKDHATAYTAWLKATHYLQNNFEFIKRNKVFVNSFKNGSKTEKV